jgi:hypothetical protein
MLFKCPKYIFGYALLVFYLTSNKVFAQEIARVEGGFDFIQFMRNQVLQDVNEWIEDEYETETK